MSSDLPPKARRCELRVCLHKKIETTVSVYPVLSFAARAIASPNNGCATTIYRVYNISAGMNNSCATTSTTGRTQAMKKIATYTSLAALTVAGTLIAGSAYAGGQNYGKTWQDWQGARIHGYVQIQGSYNDGGQHAKQGYHRFTRPSGPSLDTGRMTTSQATSSSDGQIRSREDWVWDSPLWGDSYVTSYNWGVYYF